MKYTTTICSTKKLKASVKQMLNENNIGVVEMELLEANYQLDAKTRSRITRRHGPIVATSRHALDSLLSNGLEKSLRSPGMYCLSGETFRAASKLSLPVIATANDGTRLATKIIADGIPAITYFCGEVHRPELPLMLREKGIEVNEVVVYRIVEKPVTVENTFNHVLFFSPRSAIAFLRNNPLPPSAVCFCIGETTATHLRAITGHIVVASLHPTQEELAKIVCEFITNRMAVASIRP